MSTHAASELQDKELVHASPLAASPAGRNFCVFLVGMHRSGTSLCASIIHKLGVNMVQTSTPAAFDNPKGHWERFDIVDAHDRIMSSLGLEWSSLQSLPAAWWRDPCLAGEKAALLDMARQLGDSLPWGFKDPRTTRLFPLWEEIATRLSIPAKRIMCIRNPRDVAESLNKRNNFDINYSKLLWLRHYTEFFQNRLDGELLIVDYDDWFSDGYRVAYDIVRYLGIEHYLSPLTIGAICSETITPSLQHNTSAPEHDFCAFIYNKLKLAGSDPETRLELQHIFSNVEHLNKYYTKIYADSRQYDILRPQHEELASRHAACEDQLAGLQALSDEKNACQAEANGLQAALAEERNLAVQLRAQLNAALNGCERAGTEALAASHERDAARAEANARQAALDAALADCEQVRNEALAASRERDAALAEANARQAALGAALADSERVRNAALAEAHALGSALDGATGRSEGLREQLAALEARCGALESGLASLGRERGNLLRDLVAASAHAHPCHFNEAFYLQANPDVAKAVADKLVASGLDHWLRFGYAENRAVSFLGDDDADT
ncbi:hypothetical protein DVDV_1824 [Desulfovibrio sp. DV]|uniref:sulfotransferase family protein n=1 Tax=Desulfovibrio sp. DV TaxID=1844708 RepID=UPI00094B8600|nr:hypothetical protein [Desulfovibrio sp. DV]OLN27964.1 hypothetical protein DVDV_1824 [Desulfovibrio sp. DV]